MIFAPANSNFVILDGLKCEFGIDTLSLRRDRDDSRVSWNMRFLSVLQYIYIFTLREKNVLYLSCH